MEFDSQVVVSHGLGPLSTQSRVDRGHHGVTVEIDIEELGDAIGGSGRIGEGVVRHDAHVDVVLTREVRPGRAGCRRIHHPRRREIASGPPQTIQHRVLTADDLPDVPVHEDHSVPLVSGQVEQQLCDDLHRMTARLRDPVAVLSELRPSRVRDTPAGCRRPPPASRR